MQRVLTSIETQVAPQATLQIRGSLVARNTALNLAGQIAPLFVGIVTTPYVVRHLGVDRFGILAFAWVVVGYLGLFDLGLSQATTKFVAELFGKGEAMKIPQMLWTATISQLLLGAAAGAILGAVSPVLAKRVLKMSPQLIGESEAVFFTLAIVLPLIFAAGAPRGALAAAQRQDLLNVLWVPSSCLAYLIPVAVLATGRGLRTIVVLLVIARVLEALVCLALCVHVFPALRGGPCFRFELLRSLISYGGWVTVSTAIVPLLLYLDRFLIGALLSVAALGYYTPAFSMATRLGTIPSSLMGTLFPAFSTLTGAGDRDRTEIFFARSLKYLLILVGPLVIVLLLFARPALTLWLGPEFARQSTQVLQILTVGVLFNCLTFVPISLLHGMGRPDLPAKFYLLELPLYVAGAWLLVPKFGIGGAALAWTLRVALDNVLIFWGALAAYRISPRLLCQRSVLRGLGGLSLLGAGFWAVSRALHSLPGQAGGVASLTALFAFAVYVYGLDSQEKAGLRLVMTRIGRWSPVSIEE